MYFSAENLLGVNPVVMKYKIRHSKNRTATRPARYSLVLPDLFSRYHLWWQKNGRTRSGHARVRARVAMEEGLLSVCVSQSMSQSRSVDEYCYLLNSGFARTRWHILCSYSYRANEALAIPQMFSCELHPQKFSSVDDFQYTLFSHIYQLNHWCYGLKNLCVWLLKLFL